MGIKIVCLSDTHNMINQVDVPDGDILVHAGDLTGRGRMEEIEAELRQIAALPHKHKIIIAGNHDFGFEQRPDMVAKELKKHDLIYLQDSSCEVEGIKFYGSPWQPWFHSWAFNFPMPTFNEERARRAAEDCWWKIPADTQVLITHGPPIDILDRCSDGKHAGCPELLKAIQSRPAIKLHVFGHIHEDYGQLNKDGVTYVNASNCTLQYKPTNKPIVIEL